MGADRVKLLARSHSIIGAIDRLVGKDDVIAQAAQRVVDGLAGDWARGLDELVDDDEFFDGVEEEFEFTAETSGNTPTLMCWDRGCLLDYREENELNMEYDLVYGCEGYIPKASLTFSLDHSQAIVYDRDQVERWRDDGRSLELVSLATTIFTDKNYGREFNQQVLEDSYREGWVQ